MQVEPSAHAPELLYKCMVKATTAEGDQRKYGPNWAFSRRGSLKVFDDRLECGDWQIAFCDLENAVLYSFRSFFFRLPGYILTVEANDKTYHFGLNGWGGFWKGQLPFEVKREKGKLQFSWFSIAVRTVLVGYLGYALWLWAT